MHNVILNRIRNQTQAVPIIQPPVAVSPPFVNDPPLSLEELRTLLSGVLQDAVIEPVITTEPIRIFPHLWSFVEWYEPIRENFPEHQRTALDTLLQTRDMVNSGCGCKRASRETAANAYFQDFWLKNQENDLIPSVLKQVGSEKIQFANFLTYPI